MIRQNETKDTSKTSIYCVVSVSAGGVVTRDKLCWQHWNSVLSKGTMKLISFSGSGIVHKLDNLTNSFISVQNGNMWGPELQKQTWILSQTWSESGTLFKCLKAQPAAGFPETELGETRTVALHVSVYEGRHFSCWKNANTAINNTEGLKQIINSLVVGVLTPPWVASHCSAVLYARLRRNVGPGQ